MCVKGMDEARIYICVCVSGHGVGGLYLHVYMCECTGDGVVRVCAVSAVRLELKPYIYGSVYVS